MKEKIKSYIDYLFANAPDGTEEMKEDIMSNTLDKYDDFIASGKSEEEAFNAAVAGIGDVETLFSDIRNGKGGMI